MRVDRSLLDPVTATNSKPGFTAALADLKNGAPVKWVFEVARVRIDGELDFSGHWLADGRRFGLPDWKEPRHGFEGVTTFEFTNLCAPVYAAMMAEG